MSRDDSRFTRVSSFRRGVDAREVQVEHAHIPDASLGQGPGEGGSNDAPSNDENARALGHGVKLGNLCGRHSLSDSAEESF